MAVTRLATLLAAGCLAVSGAVQAYAQAAAPEAAPATAPAATTPAPAATTPAPAATTPAAAAPASPAAALDVELNGFAPSQKGCMMTFVALNTLPEAITKVSFELAFFNDKNAVDKITVLDFRDLPQGKKRVRQFDMPNLKCESVTRVLINDTPACEGPDKGACMKGLVTRSQVSIPFEG